MKWPHHRNLRNRPPTPSKGRGPVKVRIRRAFIASGAEVLSSTQIYDWTHSRRRQSRRKKLPFGVYWRTLKTLRAKCDPVERVPPHGAWLWRLRNDEAIGSSPFPWRKQETGAAGPTPNPASTNHLAPQYTVSDAKVGNPTNALRISKTARKRGRRLWLAVAARSLRREDQVLVISSSVSRSSACLAGGPAIQGRRAHVDHRRRGSNSRPHRLLDPSACNSVLLR